MEMINLRGVNQLKYSRNSYLHIIIDHRKEELSNDAVF